MVNFKTIVFLLFCFCAVHVKAQMNFNIKPLHYFFQKYADSTYIVQYTGGFLDRPDYYLLSKKGDTISSYSYSDKRQFDERIKGLPKVIRDSVFRENTTLISFLPVGINIFLNPIYLTPDSARQMWHFMKMLKAWQIKDDKIDGEGCDVGQNQHVLHTVDDGGATYLYLITKKEIKELYFYAPDYYSEKCPGRKGRETIQKINKLFSVYLIEGSE